MPADRPAARLSIRARLTAVATAMVALVLVLSAIAIVRFAEADLVPVEPLDPTSLPELSTPTENPVAFTINIDEITVGVGEFHPDQPDRGRAQIIRGSDWIADAIVDRQSAQVTAVLLPGTQTPHDDTALIADLAQVELLVDVTGWSGMIVGPTGPIDGTQPVQAETTTLESLDALRRAMWISVPALTAAMAILIWWLAGRALRPVQAIASQVEAITATGLDQRVPVPPGSDAIARLAGLMNEMLDRLERSDARQRRFAADASHELRSPLSTVRAAAERIERLTDTDPLEGLAGDIVAESDRMNELISALLALSQSDEAASVGSGTAVELVAVVSTVIERCENPSVSLTQTSPPTVVWGHPIRLELMVQNLISNAVRHCRDRVEVSIVGVGGSKSAPKPTGSDTLAADPQRVQLRVDDDGVGVPLAERERIFERFSRLDEARSRDRGGWGLGLALVQAIAAEHDAFVWVEDSALLGGSSFVVDLPAAHDG